MPTTKSKRKRGRPKGKPRHGYKYTVTAAYAQELAVLDQAQAGCPNATRQLLDKYTPLLWKFVLRIKARGLDRDDLFQEAVVVFYEAIRTYDARRARFITFLYIIVPHKLQRAAAAAGVIRTPAYLGDNRQRQRYKRFMAMYGVVSLHEFDNKNQFADNNYALPFSNEPDPADLGHLDDNYDLARARAAMAGLRPNYRYILERRFAGDTLQTIAARLRVTRERVRQIEGKALAKVKAALGLGDPV